MIILTKCTGMYRGTRILWGSFDQEYWPNEPRKGTSMEGDGHPAVKILYSGHVGLWTTVHGMHTEYWRVPGLPSPLPWIHAIFFVPVPSQIFDPSSAHKVPRNTALCRIWYMAPGATMNIPKNAHIVLNKCMYACMHACMHDHACMLWRSSPTSMVDIFQGQ